MGEPLSTIAHLVGGPRIDDLLARAASQAPRQTALRTRDSAYSYAELDHLTTECARRISCLARRSGAPVAIAACLDPLFAVAYYGVSRSGNVSVIINPLHKAERLAHALSASGAEIAILTPALSRELSHVRGRLHALRHVIVASSPQDLAAAPCGWRAPGEASTDDVACILFTSGTTGEPKAVPLSHRQILVNAAQTAAAQSLDESSVLFNYLPTFHTMHLNAAVCVAATQCLWSGNDVIESVQRAASAGVTHYYTLPMRLTTLATDPRLAGVALPSANGLLSGGSALPGDTVHTLSAHFGIPVVQGYGLAEASPLTHFNALDEPRTGSCGRPVAGTQCRVVEIASREVVCPPGRGEVQVRGPQVMRGYLDGAAGEGPDAAGWLSTGDIGRIDDGHLFVVDRLKDVFKCENELVSPAELERLLRRHPAVADCAVADLPDQVRGAVPHGLVVLRGAVDLAELASWVNEQVPSFMALRSVRAANVIPRSANGKIQRRDLRKLFMPA